MRYYDFILNEGYPEAQKEFAAASGDPNLSSEVIGQYRTLVNRNQVQGNERNIDWWRSKVGSHLVSLSPKSYNSQVKHK